MDSKTQDLTREQQYAYDMIAKTNNSFFLTGRAGTGKSTFLRLVQEQVNKNFVVLAPTGVAAMNVGGQTIHSFFGFPFGVLCPGDCGNMNTEKIALVRHLDTIIIDEVSMTRCDVIDAIDRTLRMYRRSFAPFGGIQMVFVGDMFQLEPVTTNQDAQILREFYGYGSYYFYKAAAMEHLRLPKIEFTKIYRQSDPLFINLLENIRTGRANYKDLMRINSRVQPDGEENRKMKVILTMTRRNANAINESRLESLDAPQLIYEAQYQGDPKKDDDVVLAQLVLKEGAQVMFTRNDTARRWSNGTIGVIEKLTEDSISVRLDERQVYDVQPEQWDNIEYEYDKEAKRCLKTVKGSTIQYPLRLAWAITVHKSQSLTFDRVAIDFGQRAFCNGQAYVALSRVRSLEGLDLLRPMTLSSVMVSKDVLQFSSDVNDDGIIKRELAIGEAVDLFIRTKDYDAAAVRLFDMGEEAARAGDMDGACDLICRSMSFLADDGCLKDRVWDPTGDTSYHGRVLDATGLFYSGQLCEAERILEGMRTEISRDVNALYILSRCKEESEDWSSVEQLFQEMLMLQEDLRDRGLDDEAFRKVRYRLAILNEHQFGDPGAGVMRQLIAENPSYKKYHEAIRRMIASNDEAKEDFAANDDNGLLVKMIFAEGVSDEEFAENAVDAWGEKSDAWNDYRRFLNNLKLAMPY